MHFRGEVPCTNECKGPYHPRKGHVPIHNQELREWSHLHKSTPLLFHRPTCINKMVGIGDIGVLGSAAMRTGTKKVGFRPRESNSRSTIHQKLEKNIVSEVSPAKVAHRRAYLAPTQLNVLSSLQEGPDV